MSLGPDIGKAIIAAANVFRVIEYPTKINALDQDKKNEQSQPLQPQFSKAEIRWPRKLEFHQNRC